MKTRVVHFGVFTALALIFSYVETLIPIPIGIPGIKLGLANLIIVIGLFKFTEKEISLLMVTRVMLAGFMFGNLSMIIYSLAGGICSLIIMLALKKMDKFSIFGISMAGGVCHNVGQLLVAVLTLESLSIMYYMPILLITGLVTGFVIGLLANEIMKRMKTV